ncbi:PREDICTED: fucolectin-like [Nanorana parkeri]|uniref:fucolectin-like n=1 Tax=Nanorana parkeri TaxID=125878 RepID=UPI000854D057|nr:PREDICTED: fucolectin-like [Nanorana parkeri]
MDARDRGDVGGGENNGEKRLRNKNLEPSEQQHLRSKGRVTGTLQAVGIYRVPSRMMKALETLLLLGWLGLVGCCSPEPGAVNIARSGEASQSSTITRTVNCNVSNAIDGGKDQNWGHGSCSHTDNDMAPWWRLDLKQKYKVNMVVFYGRSDGYLYRMNGLEVRVGDSPNNDNPVCGTITNSNNATTTFCCNGMAGRYISAVIPGRSEYLTLCEVEVYGELAPEEYDVC